MKKLFILALIGLGLSIQAIKAEIPDLSDWVRANTKLPEADRDLGRAATVILFAKQGTDVKSMGKTYKVVFEGENRQKFDKIMAPIPHGLHTTMKALREGTIGISRSDIDYKIYGNRRGLTAKFRIATLERIQKEERAEFKRAVISGLRNGEIINSIKTSDNLAWVDNIIRVISEYYSNGINRVDGCVNIDDIDECVSQSSDNSTYVDGCVNIDDIDGCVSQSSDNNTSIGSCEKKFPDYLNPLEIKAYEAYLSRTTQTDEIVTLIESKKKSPLKLFLYISDNDRLHARVLKARKVRIGLRR